MPYIMQALRQRLAAIKEVPAAENAGELNYLFTEIMVRYILQHGLNYGRINDVVGALECAKREFQRRHVDDYEHLKMRENGDIP